MSPQPSSSATKRLLRELTSASSSSNPDTNNPYILHLSPRSETNLFHWTALIRGSTGTAYEHGLWELDIKVPDTYPLQPPKVTFVTRIVHPNVGFKTGEICLDLLTTSWTPAYTLSSTVSAIQQLLTSAEPDSPLNIDAAQLLRQGDLAGAESLVRFYAAEERAGGR